MKTNYFILAALMLVAVTLFIGCDYSREKKVENAKENAQQADYELEKAQIEYEKEWQQFKTDAEFRIRTNENRIAEFKNQIKTAKGEFKAKYEREVSLLEEKNIELKKKLSEYKYEGKAGWTEFKEGVNRDLDAVGTALNDFFTK
jgi:hypothetical protein